MEQGKPAAWLIPLVAGCLDIPEQDLDPRAALTQYGLDSLSAAQLTAAIEDRAGFSVPEWLLLDCPTLESVEQFLCRDAPVPTSPLERRVATPPLRQMLTDSRLPVDCQPPCQDPVSDQQSVLLTGATGFLGSHILDRLLRETAATVICMVRRIGVSSPRQRLDRALQEYGLRGRNAFPHRLEVIEGDLCQPWLGLPAHQFAGLADEVDTIYHSAAAVNWVHSYRQLKPANVAGTRELIRFACRGRPKAFHFISTVAVCYSTLAPREVSENEEIRGLGEGLHLGYAQSKYVAEGLIREAVDRGLRASVFRPSLICGNSISGISNHQDLLVTLIKGCIQMGSAPDLDWLLDCCPVDHVSRAVVRLSAKGNGGPFHILNPRKRHWRELVLWMNLYGYPVSLIPYCDWLDKMEGSSRQKGHALHSLRSLFLRRTVEPGEPTIPELYEEGRRSRALAEDTEIALGSRFPACPALTPKLLDRYFNSLVERGFLPAPSRRGPGSTRKDARTSVGELLSSILADHFAEPAMNIQSTPLEMETDDSILTELTSWKRGTTCGLGRFRVTINSQGANHPRELDLVLKDKARDAEIIEVGTSVARLCGEPLGRAYSQFKNRIGFSFCHLKELALYRQSMFVDGLGRHMPAFYGCLEDEDTKRWALLIEHLSNMRLMGSADEAGVWQPRDIQAALRGAAEIHGIWYRRGADLRNESWLGPVMSARDMTRMKVLWRALAEYAAPYFISWGGDRMCRLQRRLIESVDEWWSELESQPWTLIHNDFNPRNLALRDDGSDRLCVYDWELATLGAPQHDLAEFLCFVLTPDVSHQELSSYLDFHRRELERSTTTAISPRQWRLGFELSLYDLLVNRFSLYVLVHRFRGLKFLPRLIETWAHINRLLETRGTLTRMSA